MLTNIEVQEFKCFARLRLPLAPLTLLTGTNTSGKSTILQPLVLLHQNMFHHEWANTLQLNGPDIHLGTAGDVIDNLTGRGTFSISLEDNERRVGWTFEHDGRQSMSVRVLEYVESSVAHPNPKVLRYL